MEIKKNNIKLQDLTEELGEETVYFKAEEEVKNIHKEVFKTEMSKVKFNQLDLTMRT